jgi:glycosyltransferase involved in cell wall biosynthesis
VHIIDHLGLGGAQTQLARLAPLLAQAGSDIQIVCLRTSTPLSQAIQQAGVCVTHLGMARWNPIQIVQLVALLRRLQPAIVHTHLTAAGLVGRIAARLAAIPHVIVHEHLGLAYELSTTPVPVLLAQRVADRWLMRSGDRWIAVAEAARQAKIAIQALPPEQVLTVFNGLDPQPYRAAHANRANIRATLGIEPNQRVIMMVGRLIEGKGQALLLRAIAKLGQHDHLRCLIVGSGPDLERLQALSHTLAISSIVQFLGRRNDIPNLLAAADIFTLPSYSEAFSVAILEAMAAELPIIATAVGGATEQLDHGACGILIQPGNREQLTQALDHLLNNPATCTQLGLAGYRQLTRLFTLEQMVQQIQKLYMQLSNGAHEHP